MKFRLNNEIIMTNKPKIAVIGLKGLPAFGGAAAVGENILEQLKDKYDFTVYSISSHTHLRSGTYNNICYQKVLKSLPFKKLNSIFYYIRAALSVFFGNYDLVHLHHRDASFIIPLLRLKYPVILTTHGMVLTDKWKRFKKLFNLQDRLFMGSASVITTVSLKDYEIVSKLLKKKNQQFVYIPNGVSLTNNSFEKKNTIVFSAGRIIPNKGVHILLEALSQIKIDEKIQIIGDLEQMQEYGDKIREMASKNRNVELVGLIKDKDKLFNILGSAKCFVYPSMIESMSMMMLEVASLGTPIICSRIRENEDVFNDEEVLYFEVGNSIDLAEKLKWAIDNPSKMLLLAENAKKKLIKNHLWENIAEKYSQVYDSVLTDKTS